MYVVELNDAVRNDKKFLAKNPEMRDDKVCVYVGYTGRDLEVRFPTPRGVQGMQVRGEVWRALEAGLGARVWEGIQE